MLKHKKIKVFKYNNSTNNSNIFIENSLKIIIVCYKIY